MLLVIQILTPLQDERKMALFAQYAMACAEEALNDAKWNPTSEEDLENTVLYGPTLFCL